MCIHVQGVCGLSAEQEALWGDSWCLFFLSLPAYLITQQDLESIIGDESPFAQQREGCVTPTVVLDNQALAHASCMHHTTRVGQELTNRDIGSHAAGLKPPMCM